MPEGPEVKIASDYFNYFFLSSKKIKFEIISEYYHQKYFDVFDTIATHLKTFKPTFTIGKNIFLKLVYLHQLFLLISNLNFYLE